MARFKEVPEKKILETNIRNRLEESTTEHSKYLQGTPTFVTYYKKNYENSTEDANLSSVKELIGYDSPNKYNKIEDFVIYGIPELNPNITMDEYGMDFEITGEGVILPDTIKPNADDYFTIDYDSVERLFKITEVQLDKVNGRKFYKIQFTVDRYKVEEIEEAVDEEYVTHYENIGSENKAVINKKDSILIDKTNKFIDYLIHFYFNCFMNKQFGVITYQLNQYKIYNEYLNRFMTINDIMSVNEKGLFTAYYTANSFDDQYSLVEIYDNTLYAAIEKQDFTKFELENFYLMNINNTEMYPFYFSPDNYYRCEYAHYDAINAVCTCGDHVVIPHNNKLRENILKYELYDKNDRQYFLENIIIQYLNNKLILDDNFLEKLQKFNYGPFVKEYLLVPCLIFILKSEIKKLL